MRRAEPQVRESGQSGSNEQAGKNILKPEKDQGSLFTGQEHSHENWSTTIITCSPTSVSTPASAAGHQTFQIFVG